MRDRDGLGGISDRHPDIDEGCDLIAEAARFFKTFDGPPEQLTIDLLQQFPEREITYLVLGPMTNLYHTVQADRQVFRDRIGSVVCMGGKPVHELRERSLSDGGFDRRH
jgi:hypothetical protein